MKYGLIGEKLGHSFSREIHACLADYEYELRELSREELVPFIVSRDFLGINVTIPYKEAVIPYLDELDESAEKIGAVNTVVNRGGRLYGYNTDYLGMRALILYRGIELSSRKVAILGTGGTSKTARAVAESLGAGKIITVSRTGRDGAVTYEELCDCHSDTEVIINTTPVGMFPNSSAMPTDPARFPRLFGVIDAIYNPQRTPLVRAAREMKAAASGGLYMLVAQAYYASELFLDTKYPEGKIQEIYEKIKRKKENIVLIGMPASGKTTVARLISDATGREFIDTDEMIVKMAKMPIPEIFERYGEAHFRHLEAEAVRLASMKVGAVIATGGGAVLKAENVGALRSNGRIYFIDRPLASLIPTSDRPLSSTREAIEARYSERYPIYSSVSDVRIDAVTSAEAVAKTIIGVHER